MEMNTRVQVEHPVTEMVTGVDLVEQQIRVAAGEKLELPDTRPWSFRGHAIECRINAEDPRTFAPWPGLITEYHPPGGGGVRVDSGVYGGWRVPQHYDSLIAKVIVHAPTRAEAIARMRCALDEFIVGGIRTNIPLHKRLLARSRGSIAGDDVDAHDPCCALLHRRGRCIVLQRVGRRSGRFVRPERPSRIRSPSAVAGQRVILWAAVHGDELARVRRMVDLQQPETFAAACTAEA